MFEQIAAPRAVRFTLLAGISAVCLAAQAQPDSPPPLSLDTAIAQTLARNPDLHGFTYRLRVRDARADTAALRPPLEIHAGIENVFGDGRVSGLDEAEATISIARVIELGDKRSLRMAAAGAESEVLAVERAAAELDVLAEVTRRFIHVAADQEKLALAERAAALAAETRSATEARVAAARAPEVELRRARIAVARAGIEHEHAGHELLASRRKLAAMWGDSDALFGTIEADFYALPPLVTFETLLQRLDGTPDLARFLSEARLRDAEIRLAESRVRRDLTVSAGVRRLQQSRDQALVLGVTVPLGDARRAVGAITEARALRGLTNAERHAHRIRAQAQLFQLYQELRHAITETDVLRNEVLPEMEAALAATREAYESGRYGYLEWVDAQRELVDIDRALIESAANMHRYRIEIERLTGESLSPEDR